MIWRVTIPAHFTSDINKIKSAERIELSHLNIGQIKAELPKQLSPSLKLIEDQIAERIEQLQNSLNCIEEKAAGIIEQLQSSEVKTMIEFADASKPNDLETEITKLLNSPIVKLMIEFADASKPHGMAVAITEQLQPSLKLLEAMAGIIEQLQHSLKFIKDQAAEITKFLQPQEMKQAAKTMPNAQAAITEQQLSSKSLEGQQAEIAMPITPSTTLTEAMKPVQNLIEDLQAAMIKRLQSPLKLIEEQAAAITGQLQDSLGRIEAMTGIIEQLQSSLNRIEGQAAITEQLQRSQHHLNETNGIGDKANQQMIDLVMIFEPLRSIDFEIIFADTHRRPGSDH